MRHLFAMLVLLLIPATAGALGREVSYEELQSRHSNHIVQIKSCGDWSFKNDRGFYRITHASLYAQSLVYVQWMVETDGDFKPLHTLSIAELNNDHADISLENLKCKATKDGIVIDANAHFGHEGNNGRLRIIIQRTPGKYRFQRDAGTIRVRDTSK